MEDQRGEFCETGVTKGIEEGGRQKLNAVSSLLNI